MKKISLRKEARNVFFMFVGTFIFVVPFCIFLYPNDLLAGGVFGIAAVLNHFAPQVSLAALVVGFNIPLLILAWKKLSRRFTIYTVLVIALQGILLFFLQPHLPTYTANPLLACIFGGVVVGIGDGLIIRYYGSTGGIEIVSLVMQKRMDVSLGTLTLIGNVIIVGLAAFVFGFEKAMYTMVSLYATAYAFDAVLKGFKSKRNVMIISTKGQEIAQRLIFELNRGVTIVDGTGGFSHEQKDVLICVVSRMELVHLKDIVKAVDPAAFVMINETYDVMGDFPRRGQKRVDGN
ncbi:MAG: YitT family protein [Bacillota bacterium]|jgi:uncharacterized membrane-anchored protein YitT (DUF2179 family)